MFLKSLEIYGFKSFADRTYINFTDGITALLGPNGCGKSNVVDAVKWVLAENKVKNLRAEAKEDVIFNGTESRPALSMAEVTLTIANENGLLPLADEEVAIKRRLYRNGEDEYYVNGSKVNATAIRKLFLDTGVGKAAYSVMEQGKIDQILSSKPEDRRYLFEEAAGISRSKAEVLEAERELERTRINLETIEATLAETKRSYESLKVQAEKTIKYRQAKDEQFEFELDIQLLKLKDFTNDQKKNTDAKAEAEASRDAINQEIQDIYNSLNENTDKVKELQEQVGEKQQEQIRIASEQQGIKNLTVQLKQHMSEVKEKIGQIENRIKNIQERIEEGNEEIDSLNADLYEKNKKLEDIIKNIDGFVDNINLSNTQIEENEVQINSNSGKINNLNLKRNELQKELEGITEDIVTELDAKLKDAGYSSTENKKAKEEVNTLIEKIKIFTSGRNNIFKDFAKVSNHSNADVVKFGNDAVESFEELSSMLNSLTKAIESYTKTTPQFIDDFLSPEGIITKKRNIDNLIQDNLNQIDEITETNKELTKLNSDLSKRINEYRDTLSKLRVNEAEMKQQITTDQVQISTLKKQLTNEKNALTEQENELDQATAKKEENEEQLAEYEEQIGDLQIKGEAITKELSVLDAMIAECNSKVSGKENDLQKKQEERNKFQAKIEKLSLVIAQNETEIRNVKQNFQEHNSRDLMEFEERMYTITTPVSVLKENLAAVKQQIAGFGSINQMAVEDFAEAKERYERQQENYDDTKKTLDNLVRVSEEIRTKSSEMFMETYNKIRKNFHNMFRRLFDGGRAELRLVDPANVLTSGIDILAQPPGKKLENISLLSGGEKTMTAIALLFATYQVRPSPFCLLDEIDAALDDKNVTSFVNSLRTFANVSQYIVITHNRKTAVVASNLLGVTMQESGITKVIQLQKDENLLNGKATYEYSDDFVEEDVAPEEGIVIPPRPPRREHNPDGSLKVTNQAE